MPSRSAAVQLQLSVCNVQRNPFSMRLFSSKRKTSTNWRLLERHETQTCWLISIPTHYTNGSISMSIVHSFDALSRKSVKPIITGPSGSWTMFANPTLLLQQSNRISYTIHTPHLCLSLPYLLGWFQCYFLSVYSSFKLHIIHLLLSLLVSLSLSFSAYTYIYTQGYYICVFLKDELLHYFSIFQ